MNVTSGAVVLESVSAAGRVVASTPEVCHLSLLLSGLGAV